MKRFITAAALIFALASAAFAGSITLTSVEWDNTDGKAESLVFEISSQDITALKFVPKDVVSDTQGVFFKKDDEFTFDSGNLTIFNTALAETPNGTYTMKATTANAHTEDITVKQPVTEDMTFELLQFTRIDSLTFKPAKGMIYFDPSEFSFDNTTKTLTIKKEALAKIDAGTYEMKVTENIGEETAEVTIKGNPEKQSEEEKKQEEQKQEEKKSSDSGSGGGCNAGFEMLALLCAVPMIFRKK